MVIIGYNIYRSISRYAAPNIIVARAFILLLLEMTWWGAAPSIIVAQAFIVLLLEMTRWGAARNIIVALTFIVLLLDNNTSPTYWAEVYLPFKTHIPAEWVAYHSYIVMLLFFARWVAFHNFLFSPGLGFSIPIHPALSV